jgi:C4-dicarboxylate transporter, DctM subunit
VHYRNSSIDGPGPSSTDSAILGILAIETGLLTPPFGMLVFTVKAALPQERLTTGEIFAGSVPYWICLLVVIVIVAAYPPLATWLPNLGH